jgi:putative salt-induced outer membrane protein YdiY
VPCSRRVWAVLFVLVTSHLFADQLVLKNGDRLSGSIAKYDGKSVVIKTDFEGDVTVKWDAVDSVTSTQDLHVGLKDGKTVVGPVSTTDGKIEVATKTSGTVETPKEAITAMRSDAEQKSFELSQHPGLLQGWNGGANLGFAATRGNSETKNLAVAFLAARTGLRDKLALYVNSIYASNDAAGAVPSTTANTVQGGIRYDHDLTPRVFGFGNADFQTDALQSLDLRSVFGGGLGVHIIKSDATTLDLLGGANYTHEKYSLFTRNFSAAQIGEEFMHKVHASTVISQKLYFFPDLTDTGEYRATFDFGTVTKISKWLGWQNTFSDVYVTNPPAGKKQNDIVLSTGLNVSFTH